MNADGKEIKKGLGRWWLGMGLVMVLGAGIVGGGYWVWRVEGAGRELAGFMREGADPLFERVSVGFSGVGFGDREWEGRRGVVSWLPRVGYLGLGGTGVSDRSVGGLARMGNVECVDLSDTGVTDAGLRAQGAWRGKEVMIRGHQVGRFDDAAGHWIGKWFVIHHAGERGDDVLYLYYSKGR